MEPTQSGSGKGLLIFAIVIIALVAIGAVVFIAKKLSDDNSTYTWTGEYFKISTLNGGAALTDIDLSVIKKVVLNIDFSSQYARNDNGSYISVAMNLGKTVSQLVSEYNVQIIPPDDIQILPTTATSDESTIGNVVVGDADQSINFRFNTDTYMKDKKATFTFVFT